MPWPLPAATLRRTATSSIWACACPWERKLSSDFLAMATLISPRRTACEADAIEPAASHMAKVSNSGKNQLAADCSIGGTICLAAGRADYSNWAVQNDRPKLADEIEKSSKTGHALPMLVQAAAGGLAAISRQGIYFRNLTAACDRPQNSTRPRSRRCLSQTAPRGVVDRRSWPAGDRARFLGLA
jgi:hypothetical protein